MSIFFANPALLWGLLAAAIPIAVHLFFRRRPRPTPFPAIEFIIRARRETQRRLRLKKILLFAARTLLLLAIALAVTRPRLEEPGAAAAAASAGPRATAIVLDASGSMRYRLDGKALFERARSDALGALASLSSEEPATAVVCGPDTPAAEAPSFDRAAVKRVLERAEAAAGHSDLTACLAAAVRGLSEAQAQSGLAKRVVIATDLTASAWRLDIAAPTVDTPEGQARPEVMVLDAARGEGLPNAAVVGLEAEPDPAAGPRGYKISAVIANHALEPLRDVSLQLALGAGPDARTAIRAFADVPANGSTRKTLSHSFPQGGPAVLRVALPGDALDLDDARYLVLQVPREVRALVVDGEPSPVKYRDEAYFVDSALASSASPVHPRLVDAESFPNEDLTGVDVIFLLNVRSVGEKAAELERFVERGGGLFVSVGSQVDPDAYARELGAILPMQLHVEKVAAERGTPGAEGRAARFSDVDWDHPALAVFSGEAREGFLGTRTYKYLLARPRSGAGGAADGEQREPAQREAARPGPAGGGGAADGRAERSGARVLASFDDGSPALVEGHHGKGRVLLFTSTVDRDWSDWPIRTSFLPAMQRFAGFLAGGLDDRREAPIAVGGRHAVELGEGESLAALVGPDGRERRGGELEREGLREAAGGGTFTPRESGLWQVKVRSAAGEERLEPKLAFAVSPDPRESDTRRLTPEELTAYFGGKAVAKVDGDEGARGGPRRAVPLWSVLLLLGVAAFFLEGTLIA